MDNPTEKALRAVDLAGRRFGGLRVTGPAKPNRAGMPQWRCQCACGKRATAKENALLNGYVRSCGCGKKVWYRPAKPYTEKRSEIVADHGDWLEIDVSTEKHPDAIMKIDKADWAAINDTGIARAYATTYCGGVRATAVCGQRRPLMHRLVLKNARLVYHKDGDPLNNRRNNLTKERPSNG